MLVLAAAVIGESLSDTQLRDFKARSVDRNAVCNVGLWRWSRHPNYFFEWLAWLAYPVIAIVRLRIQSVGLARPDCADVHVWGVGHVSGIPPLENHMLRTRGDAFRDYQRRTRPFLPLPLMRQHDP